MSQSLLFFLGEAILELLVFQEQVLLVALHVHEDLYGLTDVVKYVQTVEGEQALSLFFHELVCEACYLHEGEYEKQYD